MKPIVFGGRFGWIHPGVSERGVVLCNSCGHEDAWGHDAMRYLAEELSKRNVPALRFDYRATGDSADNELGGPCIEGFVADIESAIDRLHDETGATKVTLVGLRLGGASAALASHHPLVDSLVLLATPTNGRRYLRELKVLHKTWLSGLPPAVQARQARGVFNVLGQEYSEKFLGQLRALDLVTAMSQQGSLPERVFMADVLAGASDALCTVLRSRGVDVRTEMFDDYLAFMQETATSVLPLKTLERTVQWVMESTAHCGVRDPASPSAPAVARVGADCYAMIETPDAIEQPVVFGSAGLFGVLCEPRDGPVDRPVVVVTNTAFSVHHGDSRQGVRIAREMARRGIASLRFDARGIGDSPPLLANSTREAISASIHSTSISADVAVAAAWLKRKGYSTVVAFGVCSGAYSALRASLIEPSIAAVIAVNLQRFYVPDWMTLAELRNEMSNTMARLGPAILKPRKWWLVLSGKRKIKPIVKALASNAAARLQLGLSGVTVTAASGIPDKPLTHPQEIVQALERKGVNTLLLYGANDDGLDQLNAHFGRHGKKLSRLRRVKSVVLDDIDHSLDDTRALANVIALSDAFIKELHPKRQPVKDAIPAMGMPQQS